MRGLRQVLLPVEERNDDKNLRHRPAGTPETTSRPDSGDRDLSDLGFLGSGPYDQESKVSTSSDTESLRSPKRIAVGPPVSDQTLIKKIYTCSVIGVTRRKRFSIFLQLTFVSPKSDQWSLCPR